MNFEERAIGEIADVTKLAGFEFTKYIEYIEDGEIIALRALNLRNGELDLTDIKRIDRTVSESLIRSKLYINDILLTYTGNGYGDCAIIEENDKYHLAPNICKIVPDEEEINPYFLYCYIRSNAFYRQMSNNMTGSGQPTIPMKTIRTLKIPVPKREMQDKIAKILYSINSKIRTNKDINNNLEQQVKALFKSWFIDFEPFGGEQPPEMQFVPLQDLCKVVTKGTTPTTLGKPFTTSGINFIKAESILDNHSIDTAKFAYIDDETNTMLKRSIIEVNDIVFTIAGTLGRFALIDESVLPANTNQAVAIIRPDTNKVTASYLYSFFIGNWHNDYYSKRVQQAVQANLSLTTIKSLPIAIHSDNTMKKYDELVNPLFALMKSNEEENRKLSTLRDTLLPKLMSDELDLSEVEI